jgi:hypothetical protein
VGVTLLPVYKVPSFAGARAHVDQKYYRNKKKKWGEGRPKQPEVNEEITIPTKHTNTEIIQTDRRLQLNILVIQFLMQHVSAQMAIVKYYIYNKHLKVFYNCSN